MRIIQVNKFHYPRGGADKYFLSLSAELEKSGDEVAVFSMQHPKNIPSPWSKYFVSRISFNEGGLKDKLKAPGRIIYSLEAKRKFRALIKNFKPDIIHIHNIYHQISPSILDAAKKTGIPVVMHLHDYKLVCPNYQLFSHGHPCEACRPNKYYRCFTKNCFKDSRTMSALAAIEMYIHHSILKIYEKNISAFISPSRFLKDKVVSFGQPAEKINIIINPYDPEIPAPEPKAGGYMLYFGRLSAEKDLTTVIKAASLSGAKLKIAGRGELEEELKSLAAASGADVEFLGFRQGKELGDLIAGARAIILASICYENMPLSLLEAMRAKKLVIGSRIGGIPELIEEGKTGFLFSPGNTDELAACLRAAVSADVEAMGLAAYEKVKDFSLENNARAVKKIYDTVLKNKSKK